MPSQSLQEKKQVRRHAYRLAGLIQAAALSLIIGWHWIGHNAVFNIYIQMLELAYVLLMDCLHIHIRKEIRIEPLGVVQRAQHP